MSDQETGLVDIGEARSIAQRVDRETLDLLATAESFAIVNDIQYGQSGELLKSIKAKQNELHSLRLSVTRPMDEAKARVMGLFKPAGERLSKAEETIKRAMLTFAREQERRRREEQARRDEAARAQQAKLDAQAERERERLQKLADANRERGKPKRAEHLDERAAQIQAPIVTAPEVEIAPPKAEGITVRTTWRAEVTDLFALVKAVADGTQQLALIEPNMAALHAAARELKDGLAIPGVQAVAEEGIVARA